jgi:hypothetical protein
VGLLRRWLDAVDLPAERRGLTDEDADLVILSVAAEANWALLNAGSQVTKPVLGRLQVDWQLVAQDLPSEEVWKQARLRAEAIGVMAISALRSATTVANLSQRIVARLVIDGGQAVRDLVPQLDAAAARLSVSGEGDRFATARAALSLVDALRRQPDRAAEVLVLATVPTSVAALGTSIVQSEAVTSALRDANWDLVKAATELGGPSAADAAAVRGRLADALRADELAVGLVARLRDAIAASTQVLARAAAPVDDAALGSSPTFVAAAPTPWATSTLGSASGALGSGSFGRAEAEARLSEIRARLRAEARLELTWQIEELPDVDS